MCKFDVLRILHSAFCVLCDEDEPSAIAPAEELDHVVGEALAVRAHRIVAHQQQQLRCALAIACNYTNCHHLSCCAACDFVHFPKNVASGLNMEKDAQEGRQLSSKRSKTATGSADRILQNCCCNSTRLAVTDAFT